jgi:hypothetical protein
MGRSRAVRADNIKLQTGLLQRPAAVTPPAGKGDGLQQKLLEGLRFAVLRSESAAHQRRETAETQENAQSMALLSAERESHRRLWLLLSIHSSTLRCQRGGIVDTHPEFDADYAQGGFVTCGT